MALTADYQGIANRHELFDEEKQLRPEHRAVVFMTMFVGMGELTPKSADAFFERARMVEAVIGPTSGGPTGPRYITREDVDRMVGLRTNVFPAWPKRKFMAQLARMALDTALQRRGEPESAPARGEGEVDG